MEGKVDDNVMVIGVEFDGLHPEVIVDAPESFRHILSYSRAVRIGNKVSFQLLLRLYDDAGEKRGRDRDELKEQGHENSGGEDDFLKEHPCKPPDKRYDDEGHAGTRNDERSDDSFHCEDYGEGSHGKSDAEEEEEEEEEEEDEDCEKHCPPDCESGSEDMKVPWNDNPDADCFKGEKGFGEGGDYVPQECQIPEYFNGRTFHQEEERTYDDQYDCLGSFSFDDEQNAEFLSDFRPPRSSNPPHPAPTPTYAHHVVQDRIVGEREKMKKTNEYKCAVEAEWAARQQEIQKQAEEAQRLRKRRKLEMSEAKKKAQEQERQLKRRKEAELRASEIKTRQEQRVKEMREADKKDEEDCKAKERYRAEMRRTVSVLQSQCRDLPSLLRSLGFRIAGGNNPSREEVRRAYREALLKYHPDHWSRTDIRQQVEAEEMIKLINLMRR